MLVVVIRTELSCEYSLVMKVYSGASSLPVHTRGELVAPKIAWTCLMAALVVELNREAFPNKEVFF